MAENNNIAAGLLLLFGLFLIIDAVVLHALTFNYAALGLVWLDPYVSHGLIGLGLVFVAIWSLEWIKS